MATGVNLVTEDEKLNIASKFVAPVIALVLLVITSSVGKPPWRQKFVFSAEKNPRQLMFAEVETQMALEAEHAHFFSAVSWPNAYTKSSAKSNIL